MDHSQRITAIAGAMQRSGLDLLVGIHDGAHFIETPNPVMVLSRFKSLGAAAALMDQSGEMELIVTPAWDAGRARELGSETRVVAADDVVDGLAAALARRNARNANVGIAGLSWLPFSIASRLTTALPEAKPADAVVFDAAATKTDAEIAHAREASRIAELAYARLL